MTNEPTIYSKLLEIQKELKAPKGQTNKHFGYAYRSCEDIMEAVKPLAHKQGCVVLLSDQVIEICNRPYVKASATLSDGVEVVTVYGHAGEPPASSRMDASQCTGSASTYARKRALDGLFAIDDTKDADETADGKEPMATSDLILKIQELCKETETDLAQLKEHYKIDGHAWPLRTAQIAIASLEKKLGKMVDKASETQV